MVPLATPHHARISLNPASAREKAHSAVRPLCRHTLMAHGCPQSRLTWPSAPDRSPTRASSPSCPATPRSGGADHHDA